MNVRGEVRALVDAVDEYVSALEQENRFDAARDKFHAMRKKAIRLRRLLDTFEKMSTGEPLSDGEDPHDFEPGTGALEE